MGDPRPQMRLPGQAVSCLITACIMSRCVTKRGGGIGKGGKTSTLMDCIIPIWPNNYTRKCAAAAILRDTQEEKKRAVAPLVRTHQVISLYRTAGKS